MKDNEVLFPGVYHALKFITWLFLRLSV